MTDTAETARAHALLDDLADRYHRDGYLDVRNVFDPTEPAEFLGSR